MVSFLWLVDVIDVDVTNLLFQRANARGQLLDLFVMRLWIESPDARVRALDFIAQPLHPLFARGKFLPLPLPFVEMLPLSHWLGL